MYTSLMPIQVTLRRSILGGPSYNRVNRPSILPVAQLDASLLRLENR